MKYLITQNKAVRNKPARYRVTFSLEHSEDFRRDYILTDRCIKILRHVFHLNTNMAESCMVATMNAGEAFPLVTSFEIAEQKAVVASKMIDEYSDPRMDVASFAYELVK